MDPSSTNDRSSLMQSNNNHTRYTLRRSKQGLQLQDLDNTNGADERNASVKTMSRLPLSNITNCQTPDATAGKRHHPNAIDSLLRPQKRRTSPNNDKENSTVNAEGNSEVSPSNDSVNVNATTLSSLNAENTPTTTVLRSVHRGSGSCSRSPISPPLSSPLTTGKHTIQNQRIVSSVRRNIDAENDESFLSNSDVYTSINNSTTALLSDTESSSDDEDEDYEGYFDIGDASWTFQKCNARMWYQERICKSKKTDSPKFSGCCGNGNITIPMLKKPPTVLTNLFSNKDAKSKHFLTNIRAYNMMFAFTSMGGKVDNSVNQGRGTYTFRLHGQNYHRIGSLIPENGTQPKFAQLYIYDTDHEIQNRMSHFRKNPLDADIVSTLQDMLNRYNVLTKSFRMARDRLGYDDNVNVKLRLIGRRHKDARTYNLPTVDEVAMLIIGDVDCFDERDLIIEEKDGKLQRINELHPSYLAMQYPLLFPRGEDGYSVDIGFSDDREGKRQRISMREWFAFRIHERLNEHSLILMARKLFHQWLVDIFTMMETQRIGYIRMNQKKFRTDIKRNLTDAIHNGEGRPVSIGKRMVLPSSFPNGKRFMIENYGDAMANCSWFGFLDFFITFTCNPTWPEIVRYVKERDLKPEDRPDI